MPRHSLTLIVVSLALLLSPSAAVATTAPTLGLTHADRTWGAGFGAVKPAAISFNGDPTSFATKSRWSSWGGSRAVGHGMAGFVWPGFGVADGTRYTGATVVAFNLGTCGGHPAYRSEEWYFPQYGQTFARASAVWNICTGKPLSQTPATGPVYCPKGQFNTWVSGTVTCAELPGIADLVGGRVHQGHTAKWISHGWICGTDLAMSRNPQTATCQSGNTDVVTFEI